MIRFSLSKATQRQLSSCLTILICQFLGGCRLGWQEATTSIFLASNSTFNVTKQDVTWINSVASCATVVNVVLCLLFTNNTSRKMSVTFGIMFYCISWLMLTMTRSANMIILIVFILGFINSFSVVIMSVYIGEVASPENREILSILSNVMFGIGKGSVYALSIFESYSLLSLFPCVISLFGVLFLFWMPESPCYLISKNLNDLARSNLCWLKDENTYERVKHDYEEMQRYVEEQNKSNIWKNFIETKHLKIFLLYMVLFAVGFINCNSTILSYGPEFIRTLKSINGNIFMNVYSVIQIILFAFGIFTVKKFSRRDLLLYGFMILFIIHLGCGLGFLIEENQDEYIDSVATITVVLLIIFMMVQVVTIGAGLEVLRTEIFSYRIKEFCGYITSTVQDFLMFASLQIYFPLRDTYGDSANFIFYAMCSLIGILCVYFFMTDTKDKTLMQIRIEHNSYGLFVHNVVK